MITLFEKFIKYNEGDYVLVDNSAWLRNTYYFDPNLSVLDILPDKAMIVKIKQEEPDLPKMYKLQFLTYNTAIKERNETIFVKESMIIRKLNKKEKKEAEIKFSDVWWNQSKYNL